MDEASGESIDSWMLAQFVRYGCPPLRRIAIQKLDLICNNLQAGPEKRHKAFAVEMVSWCKWMDKQWVGLLRQLLETKLPVPIELVEEILNQLHDICAASSDAAMDYPEIMVVMHWYKRHMRSPRQRLARFAWLAPQVLAVYQLFEKCTFSNYSR